jgi:prolipoprotein diacylglyceryltransferase
MDYIFNYAGYITFTVIIGYYINRIRNMTNKEHYNKNNYHDIDTTEDDSCETSDDTVIGTDTDSVNINIDSSNISDICSSSGDDEFIIIDELL